MPLPRSSLARLALGQLVSWPINCPREAFRASPRQPPPAAWLRVQRQPAPLAGLRAAAGDAMKTRRLLPTPRGVSLLILTRSSFFQVLRSSAVARAARSRTLSLISQPSSCETDGGEDPRKRPPCEPREIVRLFYTEMGMHDAHS